MSSTGIPPSSTLNREPKIIVDTKIRDNGKIKTIKTTKQANQLGMCKHLDIIHTQSVKGVPQNLFRNSGSKFSAVLESGGFSKLNSLCLQIDLTITGGTPGDTVGLVVPTYWFSRHEYRASNGTRHLNIVYDDALHLALSKLNQTELYYYAKAMGSTLNSDDLVNNISVTLDGSGNGSVQVFIPILGNWIDNSDLWWRNVDGDLIFDFHPASDIRTVAGAHQVNCENINFVIQTEAMDPMDHALQEKFHDKVASEVSFLDAVPVNYFNETITVDQRKNFKLDSLAGEFAFLAVYIRATGSTLPQKYNNNSLQNIGNTATVDVVKSSGQSILGDGTPISNRYLKNYVVAQQFSDGNRMLDALNIVVIPFGGSISGAWHGNKDGCLYLENGNNIELSITPRAPFVSGNYDVVIYGYRYRVLYNHFGRLSVTD